MNSAKNITLPFIQKLEHNLTESSQFIQVILGPRQVGKTTTIQFFLKNQNTCTHVYHSADKVFASGAAWINEVWNQARANYKLLVIDEIQKVENWAEVIKKLWDEEKKKKNPIKVRALGLKFTRITQRSYRKFDG